LILFYTEKVVYNEYKLQEGDVYHGGSREEADTGSS
jgi:hypothetical protein